MYSLVLSSEDSFRFTCPKFLLSLEYKSSASTSKITRRFECRPKFMPPLNLNLLNLGKCCPSHLFHSPIYFEACSHWQLLATFLLSPMSIPIYHIFAYTYIHTYMHAYRYTYIHTYIHKYIHTIIHTYRCYIIRVFI